MLSMQVGGHKRVIIMPMTCPGGALCGLGGTVEGLGTQKCLRSKTLFIGLMVERSGGCVLSVYEAAHETRTKYSPCLVVTV